MNKYLGAVAIAVASIASVAPAAAATILVADTGWVDDTITAINAPSTNSPYTFTVASASILSVTDAFIVGDIYSLTGDITGLTTFYAGSASDVQASGFYATNWTSASYSKIAVTVAAGTYNFSIFGNGAGGLPAGFAVRLDTAPEVPESATWAMMVVGFGLAGAVLRGQRRQVRFA